MRKESLQVLKDRGSVASLQTMQSSVELKEIKHKELREIIEHPFALRIATEVCSYRIMLLYI